jgi:eukaryotic-like serine/threonine-protein kinase
MGLFDSIKALLPWQKDMSDGREVVFRKNVNIKKRFEVIRKSVSGTMSTFYMARDRDTDHTIGLKIADSNKTGLFEQRFKTLKKPSEGKIAVQIEHPYVVKTYEYGTTTDGESYMVMEFLKGNGMHTMIYDQDSMLEGRRLNLLRQMAEALAAVHEAGFIHRDICPRNYICSRDCQSAKLFDFGLSLPDEKSFHQPGNRTGTPLYMAPEIIRRKWTDHRVDIFAMGVSFYQLCTFQLPWPSSDSTGLAALTHDTIPPEDILKYRSKLHPTLAAAIMTCLAVDPAKRYQTVNDFLRAIDGLTKEDAE